MMEECPEEVGKKERDKGLYERQIKIVDAQIDKLAYDLYGLTEEEVKAWRGGFNVFRMLLCDHRWMVFLSWYGISFSGE